VIFVLVERIRELCIGQSITLAELERRTGISNGTIAKWEKSEPRIGSVLKVADYFGVSIDWLLGRETKKPIPELGNGRSDKEELLLSIFGLLNDDRQWAIVRQAQAEAQNQPNPVGHPKAE